MTTKNLTKSFQGKITGKHLPPLAITNKQVTTNADEFVPNSILKKIKTDKEEINDDDDDLLLLDTYPPKNWTVPKHLKSSYEQGQHAYPIFDTSLTCENLPGDLIDAFPSPLSDRITSSRYCRRSVSSSCSRRSSILYPRHTTIPVESIQLRREETFDTLCESFPETHRSSYALLPPIQSKSLNEPSEIPATVDSQLLAVPSKDLIPSLSPPLITPEQIPAIQKEREEFTRRLLSKSLHREPMNSSITVQKSAAVKPVVTPRVQKSIIEPRRMNSVERQPPTNLNRAKLSTAISSTSINQSTHQRFGKVALDIFQPQSKSTTTKKSILLTNKTKLTTKTNVPKVKIDISSPSEQEVSPSNNDVIPSPSQPPSASNEISQTMNNNKSEEIQSPPNEPTRADPPKPKRQSSCRPTSHRPSHPVPKPLTLQGEKIVDGDCPETARRTNLAASGCCQRRGSLKGQPLIVEMFPDTAEQTSNVDIKPEPAQMQPVRPTTLKLKKPKTNFVKNTKPKKPIGPTKSKSSVPVAKIEMKSQSTSTEIETEQTPDENVIVVGGTDWMMTVKPQIINEHDESVLSKLFEASTVDDEDLPDTTSPMDDLAVSNATVMTTVDENDIQRRRESIGSEQAIEISPVLAQLIEQKVEPSVQITKSPDSLLINSDIRNIYESVRDSIRKDSSLRSLPKPTTEQQDTSLVKTSLSSTTTTSSVSQTKTLPFETSVSIEQTYNNSDTGLSIRPAFRVVNDSLNSRGSETIDSTSSHEEYNLTPLCTENDCDEIYRTARKGRTVGKGAYGTVWSYLTSTGRMIAVKEIELDEGDSEHVRDDYESVREEIYILRTLNHPNIVKFLGISLENTRLVKIFMEYLPNGTIENMLQAFGPFHNDVLKKYTTQLVEGVSYLHDNGIVHRDIKGKNIMLDIDGNIKLIDFGCAKRLKKNPNTHSQAQMLKTLKGTAHWMAPEVITESGHGKKADIWSIGCTLCEMATGKPPWSFEHKQVAILLIIANGTKPPNDLPASCPPAAHDFFRQCLTRDPSQRPSARDLLLHPFLT